MEEREIETIIEKAVEKAIKAEREESEKRESRRAYSLTFRYLKQYNDMVSSTKHIMPDIEGAGENDFLLLLDQARTPTVAILSIMERCLEELKKEQEEKGQKHKYDVLEMYFFRKMTYEQIVEKMPMGDSTPRRWVSEMVTILSTKLFGAAAIHK